MREHDRTLFRVWIKTAAPAADQIHRWRQLSARTFRATDESRLQLLSPKDLTVIVMSAIRYARNPTPAVANTSYIIKLALPLKRNHQNVSVTVELQNDSSGNNIFPDKEPKSIGRHRVWREKYRRITYEKWPALWAVRTSPRFCEIRNKIKFFFVLLSSSLIFFVLKIDAFVSPLSSSIYQPRSTCPSAIIPRLSNNIYVHRAVALPSVYGNTRTGDRRTSSRVVSGSD